MNKQTKKISTILLTGLFVAGAGTTAIGAIGGVSAAAGDNSHQITLKLNGGERLVDSTRSGADVTYTLNGDSLRLTHANVRAMFGDIAPYVYDEQGAYLSSENDVKGKPYYSTPLLYGLFVDADGDGVLDDGEKLYCSGDTVKVSADMTLTCYYNDNGFRYSQHPWGDTGKEVTFAKAWKNDNVPVNNSGESRSYTARQIQPLYHAVTFLCDRAFSLEGGWCNVVSSVELPTTVVELGWQVFCGNFGMTSVTGLDNVYAVGAESFKNSNVEELVFGDLNRFSHYAFCANSNKLRFIVENWQNDAAKWYPDGRKDNPTPWIGVQGASLASPNAYVYVPVGKTASWYQTEGALLKIANGDNWTGADNQNHETAFNLPMREMYTVTFDLNGVDGYIVNQHQDAGAVSVKNNGKELNLTSYDDNSGDQLTSTNEAERDLSLLNVKKPADPVREGMMFLGWKDSEGKIWTDADFGVNGKVLNKNETLTAQWAAPVTLTLKLNNGEADIVSNAADGSYLNEDNMDEPIREGYSFNGWYKDEALTTAWNFETDTLNGNTVIYVGWEADEYTITYNLDGGTLSENARTGYTIEDALTFETPTKEGYSFAGWYSNAAFTGDPLTEIEVGTTGNKALYAKWTIAEYTITYHLDGGTAGADAPANYTVESAVTLVAPTKEGYTFKGWYANEQLTGDPVTEIAAGTVGNKEYWAKWELEEQQKPTPPVEPDKPDDTKPSDDSSMGGCGSVLGFGVLSGAVLAVCAATVFKKRKSDR